MPLANVVVEAGEKKKSTTTDINGNYKIRIYKKDAVTISFNIEGYQILIKNIGTNYEGNEIEINGEL